MARRRILVGVMTFLAIGVALVAPVPWLFGLLDDVPDKTPLLLHLVAQYDAMQLVFLVHVLGGAVALLTGPWQLMARLRSRRTRLHRATGYLYVTAVAAAGTAGLVMGPQAWGGAMSRLGFTLLAIAWLTTTALGVWRILAGDRAGHRAWITRSFALTFAAVSLRVQAPLLGALGVADAVAYPLVAWSSWVPNLLVVHWLSGRAPRRNSAGDVPVQRRNARVNELCSENPSR
jgi:uncharacterized membrane protein